MNATLIHHFLEHSAERLPDKVALVHDDVRATYREINNRANSLARYFVERGIKSGDRILLLLENSLEYVVAYYAALKAGGVVVPLNTELKPVGLTLLLEELEASCLVTSRKYERLLRGIDLSLLKNARVIVKDPKLSIGDQAAAVDWSEIVSDGEIHNLNLPLASDCLGSIIYTSGSTGRPKGAMLSHGNIVANVNSICQYLRLTESDIQMAVQPFFYVMGKSLLNTHMAVGGRVVINNRFAYPATVIQQMIDEQVTGFSGVPSTYAYLLHKSPLAAERERLSALRYCSQAGGHMASATKLKLMDILPSGCELFIMYGATEASARLAFVEPSVLKEKIDSIGRPIPGVTLKVIDVEGHVLPVGEVGEIVAWGDNIMQGYWKNLHATQQALSEHGYHTGDLGYCDSDGYYFVVGRRDNQLKVAGHKVNIQEIEDVIMASGLAVEGVVLGIPDPLQENRLVAVMVPVDDSVVADGVIAACRRTLAGYKVPQQVVLARNLPKSASGKVDRKSCEQLLNAVELS